MEELQKSTQCGAIQTEQTLIAEEETYQTEDLEVQKWRIINQRTEELLH